MTSTDASSDPIDHELAAESITVRIRWFGLCVGYVVVNAIGRETNQPELNAILTLGAVYAMLDTFWSIRGRVFLHEFRLVISLMEAVFIGLLCYFDIGLESPFRFYYFLSLLVCAIRHSPVLTYQTLLLHAVGYVTLAISVGINGPADWTVLVLMLIFMSWVTWAITALTGLLKTTGRRLSEVNVELKDNQTQLEQRIDERTQELQESQALLVQQEKQAAFGLLAAGIAHEVGNPLASISSLVQMVNRRDTDEYTRERLEMVNGQLLRIQRTLRELVDFSRPAETQTTLCDIHAVIDEALNIAKYYKRKKGKHIHTDFSEDVPSLRIVKDQLVQIVLNLILNAMDATEEGESITISTRMHGANDDGSARRVNVAISDTGCGISAADQAGLFKPYFTTKETGTGLGLFVCRNIVESTFGGSIELTESSPDGTTFTVELPCEGQPSAAPSPAMEEHTTEPVKT